MTGNSFGGFSVKLLMCESVCECLQWWVYPTSDAGVLRIVFDSDSESVLSHPLSVQRSVHLHHTCLRDTERKRLSRVCFIPLIPLMCKYISLSQCQWCRRLHPGCQRWYYKWAVRCARCLRLLLGLWPRRCVLRRPRSRWCCTVGWGGLGHCRWCPGPGSQPPPEEKQVHFQFTPIYNSALRLI